jgi:hypothetical protein
MSSTGRKKSAKTPQHRDQIPASGSGTSTGVSKTPQHRDQIPVSGASTSTGASKTPQHRD